MRSARLLWMSKSSLAWGSVLLLGACLSPTLPLPPPEEPGTISDLGDGEWSLTGRCIEGAQVIGYNDATGRGSVYIDRATDGTYILTLEGEPCDVVVIQQLVDDEASSEMRVVLQPTTDGEIVDPTLCSVP
jgi:hypothetical protein